MGKGTPGKEAELTVDDGSGHVSIATMTISLSDSWDTVETTEQTSDVESHNLTIRRFSLSVGGNYRPGSGTGQDAGQEDLQDLYDGGTEAEFIFYPEGNASGGVSYTFNGYCTQFDVDPGGTGGNTSYSATIQLSDGTAPTRSTV